MSVPLVTTTDSPVTRVDPAEPTTAHLWNQIGEVALEILKVLFVIFSLPWAVLTGSLFSIIIGIKSVTSAKVYLAIYFFLGYGAGESFTRYLHEAPPQILQLLISYGVPVNQDNTDRPPLAKAVERNNIEAARLLIQNGASLNWEADSIQYSALDSLQQYSPNLEMLGLLLQNYGPANRSYYRLLKHAIRSDNIRVVRLFIQHGARLSWEENSRQHSALDSLPEYTSNLEMLELLLQNHVPANRSYYRLLKHAIRGDNIRVVRLFIQHGARLSWEEGSMQHSALEYLPVYSPNLAMLGLLLQNYGPANRAYYRLLKDAISQNNINIVRLFIQHGARLSWEEDSVQHSALEYLRSFSPSFVMIELLLQNHAPINIQGSAVLSLNNFTFSSTVDNAERTARFRVCERLIQNGATVDYSAFSGAIRADDVQLVRLFLNHIADMSVSNLEYQVRACHNPEIRQLLTERLEQKRARERQRAEQQERAQRAHQEQQARAQRAHQEQQARAQRAHQEQQARAQRAQQARADNIPPRQPPTPPSQQAEESPYARSLSEAIPVIQNVTFANEQVNAIKSKILRRSSARELLSPDSLQRKAIESAFRRLSVLVHPDRNSGKEDAARQLFICITKAKEALLS